MIQGPCRLPRHSWAPRTAAPDLSNAGWEKVNSMRFSGVNSLPNAALTMSSHVGLSNRLGSGSIQYP
jgi:hypothetical protein